MKRVGQQPCCSTPSDFHPISPDTTRADDVSPVGNRINLSARKWHSMTAPLSTYRLQFRNGMTFDRAVGLVPYWKNIGISHLYASPIFSAVTDSTHGYDVTDANEIDPVLGGREGFDRLSNALSSAGIGIILDIVPNHMAASLENRWWYSVLQHGEASPYATYFDIDWSQRITLPFLGDAFEASLEKNELKVQLDPKTGSLGLAYFESCIPLLPSTYALALGDTDDRLAKSIIAAASNNSGAFESEMQKLLSDANAVERLQKQLDERSTDGMLINELHDRQAWKLICWKQAAKELSYRRFFEVTGLIGLRVEDEAVFADAHRLAFELVRNGQVDGLRVDHVDGLADPKTYLERLRNAVGPETYLLVEKILARDEQLPEQWPISGTTGYEFIAALDDVFVEETKSEQLDAIYAEIDPVHADVETAEADAKRLMIDVNFEGEVSTLVKLAAQILQADATRPATGADALRKSLRDLIVAFPVYRTYGTAEGLDAQDSALLNTVIEKARTPENGADIDALKRILLGDVSSENKADAVLFRRKFQQLTGPVMAKAVEDTLFFRSVRLLALNEVGGELGSTYGSVQRFHDHMVERAATQPAGLTTTTTHDTKRGEDARARLFTIGEAPEKWADAVKRWREMHAGKPSGGEPALEPGVEWMIYQSLAGVWPPELKATDKAGLAALEERFLAFLEKSMREAKLRSNWTAVDADYEQLVGDYARRLLSPDNREFLDDFLVTLKPFMQAGLVNSLAQTLLKLTVPGVPDIYQGAEGLDFSLVDPDNRRMPDFDVLAQQLVGSQKPALNAQSLESGRLKQHIVANVLKLRQQQPELFAEGGYAPLDIIGEKDRNALAFSLSHDGQHMMAIVPRLVFDLIEAGTGFATGEIWGDTSVVLPQSSGAWTDAFTGRTFDAGNRLLLAEAFSDFPFALLMSDDQGSV